MSSHYHQGRAARGQANLYDEITDKIIADLEAGRLPWVQPWGNGAAKAPLSLPRNASTGRDYSGISVLILWGAVVEQGYAAQLWLTFRQALTLGGNVRKGERGTTVVYADRFVPNPRQLPPKGLRRRDVSGRCEHAARENTAHVRRRWPIRWTGR